MRRKSRVRKDLEELVLPASKLRFCAEQLQNLNFILGKKLAEPGCEKSIVLAKSVTERLVQRMLCSVGILDERFASKYLVNLIHDSDIKNRNLKYLVRLDALSQPNLYPSDPVPKFTITEGNSEDCPIGYARVRMNLTTSRFWAEFINSSGYLRRDKIQAKLVELLAQAASSDVPNSPLFVDESISCGSPGKILDPLSLSRILRIPPAEHVYYGTAGNAPRFPDPRDFRLAIVDEPGGIRLKVGFMSPALSSISIDVRLLVAIGIDGWPATTDFPFRIPFGHSDCLLYHRAAQTGTYLVGFGVQSSAWQIRLLPAEFELLGNYSPNSTVSMVVQSLYNVLQEINNGYAKHQSSYKILNRYSLFTSVLYELEKDEGHPTDVLLNWAPQYLSTHVLKILDGLILCLKDQKCPNYFFKSANLFTNPGHLCEEDFHAEAKKIQSHLLRLFDESLLSTRGNNEFKRVMVAQDTEMLLLIKWKELIDGLMPPSSTRGRRFCFVATKAANVAHTQYTARQLEYIGMVLKSMLNVKQAVLQDEQDYPWGDPCQGGPIEDVIYILVALMQQARDKYFSNPDLNATIAKNRAKLKSQFDACTTRLVELVRREGDLNKNLADDATLVQIILKWLYKGLDQNKQHLGPILRPYLNSLFVASHAISWHLEAIRNQEQEDESDAMRTFARLVNSGKITPAQGLIESVNKKWSWAKSMLESVERSSLRVIFVPERGKVFRHILSLPSYEKRCVDRSRSLGDGRKKIDVDKVATLPERNYFNTILKKHRSSDFEPPHCILRNSSPMTAMSFLRNGDHRCCGDLLEALASMQKINVVHEISNFLPEEERDELLAALEALAARKKPSNKKRAPKEKYTPLEESAGIRDEEQRIRDISKSCSGRDTLIGRCRAARVREDSNAVFLQHLKVKSLTRK